MNHGVWKVVAGTLFFRVLPEVWRVVFVHVVGNISDVNANLKIYQKSCQQTTLEKNVKTRRVNNRKREEVN